ncbi:MAG: hypothetical protein MZU97_00485 [Bacillus subtilis]|nr:hypothetical protein [Bacillus subtilis]
MFSVKRSGILFFTTLAVALFGAGTLLVSAQPVPADGLPSRGIDRNVRKPQNSTPTHSHKSTTNA